MISRKKHAKGGKTRSITQREDTNYWKLALEKKARRERKKQKKTALIFSVLKTKETRPKTTVLSCVVGTAQSSGLRPGVSATSVMLSSEGALHPRQKQRFAAAAELVQQRAGQRVVRAPEKKKCSRTKKRRMLNMNSDIQQTWVKI